MYTAKEAAIEAVKSLPDGCSMDDILYGVYVVSQVLEGLWRDLRGPDPLREGHAVLRRAVTTCSCADVD